MAGLVAVPALVTLGRTADTNITSNLAVVALAGLAVGLGTRMANGCTSGHGVCGISRFSIRGIAATLAYIGAGVVTLGIARQVMDLEDADSAEQLVAELRR